MIVVSNTTPLIGLATMGILLMAKKEGLLSAVRPDLEQLSRVGFSIRQNVIDAVLRQAGE